MFLLLGDFALGHLPLTAENDPALEAVAVPDHCLTAGCHLFYTETHLLPLPLWLWGLVFKTAFASPLRFMPQTPSLELQTSNS